MSKATATGDTPLFSLREVHEAEKQARAEVLAACSERIDLFMENIGNYSDEFGKKRPFKTWDRDDWEAAALRLLSDVQDALDKLQPAAKDLEELLRKAELKGLERFHPDHCYAAKKDDRVRFSWPCCGIGKRITELEKARAEGKG